MAWACIQGVTDYRDAIKDCMLLSLVDAFKGFIYICSDVYRVEYMSERLIERTGRDATGELCYKAIHDRDSRCPWCVNHRVFSGETVAWTTKSPKDNHWFDMVNLPLKKPDGSMAKLALFFDITEKQEMADQLRHSEAKHKAIFENSVNAIFLADIKTGMIIDANKMAEKLIGFSRKELLGMHQSELHPRDDEDFYRKIFFDHVTLGNAVDHREYAVQCADGARIPVEINANVIEINGKKIIQGIFMDISEKKKMQEERKMMENMLVRSQKFETLATMAGGIAHDFNNILASIIGNADLAQIQLSGDSPVTKNLKSIMKEAQRAADITSQMLAFSGKGIYEFEAINLSRLIEKCSSLLDASVKKGTVIRYELKQDIPLIQGDPSQIKQAMFNLVLNASESMDNHNKIITIATGILDLDSEYFLNTYLHEELSGGQYVFVEISDTGRGMDNETKSRIFDPFFSTKFIGRGMGLPAVMGIVRGHNGAVKVYSEPGRGSTFKLLFPCREETVIFEEKKMPLEGPVRPLEREISVLVIDDDASVRHIFQLMLETAGIKAITASNGMEGLNIFKDRMDEIDLVLLDLTMPRMGGEETYRKLRLIRPDVKVLLTSGYNETDAMRKFAGKKLCGFIQKPSDMKKIVSKVKSALDIAP